jgi:hypothetical protein
MTPTRRSFTTALAGLLLALFAGFGAATPAAAASLDQYRAQGVIAERFDGYVEVRTSDAPAEAQQIVQRVNSERREVYRKRAEEQGVSVEAVGKVYAKQIIKNAPDGTYFLQPNGGYVQK